MASGWQVDKHVPVASIVALFLQTMVAVWWLSGLAARVTELEKQAVVMQPQSERLIRLEEQTKGIAAVLVRLERGLEDLLRARPTTAAARR